VVTVVVVTVVVTVVVRVVKGVNVVIVVTVIVVKVVKVKWSYAIQHSTSQSKLLLCMETVSKLKRYIITVLC
jgi:hypothetical protein